MPCEIYKIHSPRNSAIACDLCTLETARRVNPTKCLGDVLAVHNLMLRCNRIPN